MVVDGVRRMKNAVVFLVALSPLPEVPVGAVIKQSHTRSATPQHSTNVVGRTSTSRTCILSFMTRVSNVGGDASNNGRGDCCLERGTGGYQASRRQFLQILPVLPRRTVQKGTRIVQPSR